MTGTSVHDSREEEKEKTNASHNPREGLAPWRFYMILALTIVVTLINGE